VWKQNLMSGPGCSPGPAPEWRLAVQVAASFAGLTDPIPVIFGLSASCRTSTSSSPPQRLSVVGLSRLYFLIDGLLDRLIACAVVPHEEKTLGCCRGEAVILPHLR
jgi:hypothetical protein